MSAADVRVLHVLEAVRGGTSRHVADIVRHAGGIVHHVALPPAPAVRPGARGATADGGAPYDHAMVERMKEDGAVVHEVDMRRQPWHPANAACLPRLHRLTATTGAAVVHGHSSVGGAVGRLVGRAAGRPVVYTANGIAAGAAYRAVERVLGRLTDRWVAVSPSEAREAAAAGLAAPERIVTIANGIDLSPPAPSGLDLRRHLGLAPGTPLVATVARLVAQKAPEVWVRAAAAVAAAEPDAHFLLIGMGPLQDEVDREVAALGLGVRWHQIPHLEGAASSLGQLDVFVLASRFEGGPYTPLEAMRAGVAVVLSDAVGNRDLVVDGVTGHLVASGDPAAVADAVIGLLRDPARRASLAAAAASRLGSYDVTVMGARLADLYRSLVTPAPPRPPGATP